MYYLRFVPVADVLIRSHESTTVFNDVSAPLESSLKPKVPTHEVRSSNLEYKLNRNKCLIRTKCNV